MLGDTLIDPFGVDEIEKVLAHEFGHHVHKDLTMGIIVQLVLTLFGFWPANLVMNWGVAFFGYSGLTDSATLPLLIIVLCVFGLVTMPLGNTWSRWREVKADEYALKMTDNPQAFIRAVTRLANQNLADADPPAWVEFLLHSHRSISKRVAIVQSFRGSSPPPMFYRAGFWYDLALILATHLESAIKFVVKIQSSSLWVSISFSKTQLRLCNILAHFIFQA